MRFFCHLAATGVLMLEKKTLRSSIRFLAAFAAVFALEFFSLQDSASGSQKVDLPTALKRIAQNEERYEDLSWNVAFREGSATSTNGPPWDMDKQLVTLTAEVKSDTSALRYHVLLKTSGKFINTDISGNSKVEYIGQIAEYAYDGHLFRHWHRYGKSNAIPDRDSANAGAVGEINTADAERLSGAGFLGTYGRPIAVHHMPPYFTLGRQSKPLRLSSQLNFNISEKKRCVITESDNGNWLISAYGRTGSDNFEDWWDITYDPERGIIKHARRYNAASEISQERDFELEEIAYTHKEHDGIWVPSSIASLIPGQLELYLWEISRIRVNQRLSDREFIIDFPPGVRVVDYVGKLLYDTGQSLPNEQAAVKSFANNYGHKASNIADNASRSPFANTVLFATAMVVLILVILVFRKRIKRNVSIFFMACICITGEIEKTAAETYQNEAGEWVVSYSQTEEMRITQCGVFATVYTLEIFDVPYEMSTVVGALPPSKNGIRLRDIADVLTAYGLHAKARKNLTKDELSSSVSPNVLGIVPIRVSDYARHYFVAHVAPEGTPVLLDVPRASYDFRRGGNDIPINDMESTVLFVTQINPARDRGLSDRVSHEIPDTLDVGKIEIPMSKGPHGSFIIKNTEGVPLLIKSIVPSCNCLQFSYDKYLVRDVERNVNVTVDARALKQGKFSVETVVEFVNAPPHKITITGTVDDKRIMRQKELVKVRPVEVSIVFEDTNMTNQAHHLPQVEVAITTSQDKTFDVTHKKIPSWLLVDVPPEIKTGSSLFLKIAPEACRLEFERSGLKHLYALVRVEVVDGTKPHEFVIPVSVHLHPAVREMAQ